MTRTATLKVGDQTLELPVVEGTDGGLALDISKLRSRAGCITYDPGFANTGISRSAITSIDGDAGVLRYRGVPVEQLVEHSSFVETCYLLIHGRLPAEEQLSRFQERITANAAIHESYKHHFEGFPVDAPPMAMLSAMVNTLVCYYPQAQRSTEEEFDEEAAWLISKTRTIAAYSHRHSLGRPFIYPDPRLGYVANFLHMMFSRPYDQHIPSPEVVKALDVVLILHADHELGCSTTTVRIVGSSRANLFASCAAGICSLWGPVHGGATIAVIDMLERIHRGELSIDRAIGMASEKAGGVRLKGFGHRVYRTFDPRAQILKKTALDLLAHKGTHDPLLEIALELEQKALEDPYFVDHKLFPNADFYNGIAMRAIGIPRDMFTVIFALGRMPGWIAHWKEQCGDPDGRIVRPRQVYMGRNETDYVPLDER